MGNFFGKDLLKVLVKYKQFVIIHHLSVLRMIFNWAFLNQFSGDSVQYSSLAT